MYDAIVVGARCAGSPTALLLARQGYRVLLVDRAIFPSDTMSGCTIHQPGVARLRRWGLLDKLIASDCPPLTEFAFDVGPFALTGTQPAADGESTAYRPRRTVLDKILVDAAIGAGVEVREGFSVQEVLGDGDRVTGIRGRARGGVTLTERAHLVIGADGLRSIVARSVQAPTYHSQPTLTCNYYSFWSGVPVPGPELYVRDGRFVVAVPTHDGLTIINAAWPREEFHTVRADIEGSYFKALDLAPGLAERVRSGRREERFVGTGDVPNFFRKPFGLGWALVGDSGYHKDPITAQGMTDAFRDAGGFPEGRNTFSLKS